MIERVIDDPTKVVRQYKQEYIISTSLLGHPIEECRIDHIDTTINNEVKLLESIIGWLEEDLLVLRKDIDKSNNNDGFNYNSNSSTLYWGSKFKKFVLGSSYQIVFEYLVEKQDQLVRKQEIEKLLKVKGCETKSTVHKIIVDINKGIKERRISLEIIPGNSTFKLSEFVAKK